MIPAWMIEELEELRRQQQQQEVTYEQLQLPIYYDEPPIERPKTPDGSIEFGSRVIVIEL